MARSRSDQCSWFLWQQDLQYTSVRGSQYNLRTYSRSSAPTRYDTYRLPMGIAPDAPRKVPPAVFVMDQPEMAIAFLACTFSRGIAAPISKSVQEVEIEGSVSLCSLYGKFHKRLTQPRPEQEECSRLFNETGTKLLIVLGEAEHASAVAAAAKLEIPLVVLHLSRGNTDNSSIQI